MFNEDIRKYIALIESIQATNSNEVILEGREDKMTINNWVAFERIFDAYSVKVEQDDKFGTIDIWVEHNLVGQWFTANKLGWFNKRLLATLPADRKAIDPEEDKIGA